MASNLEMAVLALLAVLAVLAVLSLLALQIPALSAGSRDVSETLCRSSSFSLTAFTL